MLQTAILSVLTAIARHGCGSKVIVVDNSGSSPAGALVEKLVTENPGRIFHAKSDPLNKCAALNAGIRLADTEWLAFTDDDTIPSPEWLVKGSEYAALSGLNVFGGKVVAGDYESTHNPNQHAEMLRRAQHDSSLRDPIISGAIFGAESRNPGPGNILKTTVPSWLQPGKSGRVPKGPAIVDYAPMPASGVLGPEMQVPLGANIFVRKSVFEKYGGYDEGLWARCGRAALGCEDAELAMRVRRCGEKIGYCAEAVVVHPVYEERATVFNHLRWSCRMGFRENILFPEDARKVSAAWLTKSAAVHLFGAVRMTARKDTAAAVCELMAAARCAGQMTGKGG